MIQSLFDRIYNRSFALDMLIDVHDITYIHESDKRVISSFGNGFISSIETANNNKFAWHVTPDDVWLFALQYIRSYCQPPQQNIIKGNGLVYEACISSIFNQLDEGSCKCLYDINFTTSTYSTKTAAKITYLSDVSATTTYQRPPATQAISKFHLDGTQQDWDTVMSLYNKCIDMTPRSLHESIKQLHPWLASFARDQKPEFNYVSPIVKSSDGVMTTQFPKEYTSISSGFVGCTLDQKRESVAPNIAWYVTRPKNHKNDRVPSCLSYYSMS